MEGMGRLTDERDGRTVGWDGQTDERTGGRTDGRTCGRTDGRIHEQTDGETGRTYGRTNGGMRLTGRTAIKPDGDLVPDSVETCPSKDYGYRLERKAAHAQLLGRQIRSHSDDDGDCGFLRPSSFERLGSFVRS